MSLQSIARRFLDGGLPEQQVRGWRLRATLLNHQIRYWLAATGLFVLLQVSLPNFVLGLFFDSKTGEFLRKAAIFSYHSNVGGGCVYTYEFLPGLGYYTLAGGRYSLGSAWFLLLGGLFSVWGHSRFRNRFEARQPDQPADRIGALQRLFSSPSTFVLAFVAVLAATVALATSLFFLLIANFIPALAEEVAFPPRLVFLGYLLLLAPFFLAGSALLAATPPSGSRVRAAGAFLGGTILALAFGMSFFARTGGRAFWLPCAIGATTYFSLLVAALGLAMRLGRPRSSAV